eukprot:COSAG06_NODE_2910_length_6103_cov_2.350600_7_plen_98_part_00
MVFGCMSGAETWSLRCALFKKKYARRSYYKPKFFEQLHEQLAAFAAGKDLEDGFLGAMTLMADVKSAKELGSCGMSTVAKAAGGDGWRCEDGGDHRA